MFLVMKKLLLKTSLIISGAAVLAFAPMLAAQEEPSLRDLPAATSPPPVVPPIRTVSADQPYYVDKGVTMAPLRSVAEFMGAKIQVSAGNLIVSKTGADGQIRSATFRIGSKNAGVRRGGKAQNVVLPLAAEKRLGVTFVPLRVLVEALGGTLQPVLEAQGGVLLQSDGLKGVLRTTAQAGYRGTDAARITFKNRVGRALSIRLSGPQNISIEMGRGQTITRSVRPGVYYYKAASNGMKTRQGARRLNAGQKATWSWGRG